MKIYIGKYLKYIGPFQIAEKLLFWLDKDDDRVFRLGERLAGGESDSLLNRFCQWIYNRRQRTIYIKIDQYDTWSMDATLSLIIAPMLRQLKETKHSCARVDDEDVPEQLKSTAAPPVKNAWDIDANWEARWNYVLDEMIFAFEQHDCRVDTERQFYDHSDVDENASLNEQVKQIKFDRAGYEAWHARKQNGFRLFGKYFTNLWS